MLKVFNNFGQVLEAIPVCGDHWELNNLKFQFDFDGHELLKSCKKPLSSLH